MGTQAGNPPLPHGLAELHRYTPADALRPHIDRAEMLRYLGYNGQELKWGSRRV